MMKHLISAAALAAALSLSAAAASAGTLTNVSVTLSDTRPSQPTAVTVLYTTATVLTGSAQAGYGDYLFVANGFNGLTFTQGACGSDVTITVDGAPLPINTLQSCQLTSFPVRPQIQLKPGQTIPAGSNIRIVFNSNRATTSATLGTYSTNLFRTAIYVGNIIDQPATQPTYKIEVPAPAPVPTLTEWAMIGLGAALAGFAALTLQRRRRLA